LLSFSVFIAGKDTTDTEAACTRVLVAAAISLWFIHAPVSLQILFIKLLACIKTC